MVYVFACPAVACGNACNTALTLRSELPVAVDTFRSGRYCGKGSDCLEELERRQMQWWRGVEDAPVLAECEFDFEEEDPSFVHEFSAVPRISEAEKLQELMENYQKEVKVSRVQSHCTTYLSRVPSSSNAVHHWHIRVGCTAAQVRPSALRMLGNAFRLSDSTARSGRLILASHQYTCDAYYLTDLHAQGNPCSSYLVRVERILPH